MFTRDLDTTMKNRRFLFYSILIAIPVTLLLAEIVLHYRWPHWQWENAPLHSTVEALGALVAVFMALILLQRVQGSSGKLFLLSMGFLGMGLLDGFHAAMLPGNGFVFLHSLAGLVGGFFFALAWLPDFGSRPSEKEWIPWAVAVSSMLCGVWALLLPGTLPVMVHNGGFTPAAININILAGVLFLAAAFRFALDFHRSGSVEACLFACMSLLFAVSGLTFQYSSIWNNGWWLWHLLRLIAFLLVLGFMIRRYLQVVSDLKLTITERKQVEEALRESEEKMGKLYAESRRAAEVYHSVLHTSADAILTYDMAGKTTYVNPSFTEIFGWALEDVEGENLHFVPESEKKASMAGIKRIAGEGKPIQGFETKRYVKDGRIIDVSMSGSRYNDHEGNPIGMLVVIRDISENKKLEAQLQQALKMEAIGTLAGGIAHDFNNLLMAIQGRASVMLMKKDSSHPDIRHLKGIENNVESAADLTKQLLGFARGGKYEVKPTDLNELVKKENRMFGRTKKEITIRGKYGKDLWTVEVDRGQIEQVLLNLYVNAWQSMPAGGGLYIKTQNVTLDENYKKPYQVESGSYVQISVTDTGPGMDKATQKRIFEPFFTTKEMGKGTGLGLASAYGIIKNHGGFINVYSEKGHGSTFNIYLPASEKEVIEEKKSVGGTLKGSETVLFVDDEDMIIEVAEEMFEQLGYKVLTARSGKEAIEIYEKNKKQIDIVLLDMIMPNMSGSDTYDKMKAIDPDIKVLLSSGYSINGQATEIMDRGCSGFIQKPFKMKELSQKLREILDEK